MPSANAFQIAVLPGDGIGPEVMQPCLQVLAAAEKKVGGFSLSSTSHPAGAGHYRDHGEALPRATLDACRSADAILLAAMGLPSVRYPDGTEIAPQIDLRFDLGLYAGVRPVKTIPGLPQVLADPRAAKLDFVLVRESTEGLFATRGKGAVVNDLAATETLVITRGVSERLFDFCFALARQSKGARAARARDLRRQGQRVCRLRLLPQDLRGARGEVSRHQRVQRLRRCHRTRHGAPTLDHGRAGDREHVRRHPLRSRRRPDGRHGHGAVGRHRRRRTPCSSPATARRPISSARARPTRRRCSCPAP